MPINYNAVFQTVGQLTYRLHFPYLLEGFEKSMLVEEAGDLFTSDAREYTIKGLKAWKLDLRRTHKRDRRRYSAGQGRCMVLRGRIGNSHTTGPDGKHQDAARRIHAKQDPVEP